MRSLVAVGRRRLRLRRLLEALPTSLLAAAIATLGAVGLDRAMPGVLPPWWIVAVVLASAGLVAAIAVAMRRDPSEFAAAVEVDRILGLRDRLSVAIESAGREDLFARAACEDAERVARDPAHRRQIQQGLPAAAPPRWWWPLPAWAAAIGFALLLPQLRGTSASAETPPGEAVREEAKESLESLVAEIAENEALADALEGDGAFEFDDAAFEDLEDPEEIQLEAIRQVTALEERLEALLQ
ncbi:MAG: hypothetical protein ACO3P9_07485, partial [Phycisphaerales bacterium]